MANRGLALQTRANWLTDITLFLSGLIAAVSGIYFLFLPTGGYRGGRNPYYGITILFDRHTWEDWHTWTGVAMIVVAALHVLIHWRWVVAMTKKTLSVLRGAGALSAGAKFNIAINTLVAISFTLTAASGLYFFFTGKTGAPFLFDSTTWDLIHTWAFVALVGAVAVHLAIHWRWITNVTGRLFGGGWQPTRVKLVNAETQA